MRVSADFSDVKDNVAVPKDDYVVRIDSVLVKPSSTKMSTLMETTFIIEGGDYDGQRLRAWPIISGKSRAGDPLIPREFCNLIEAAAVDWTCAHCGASGARAIARGTGPVEAGGNGLTKGRYFCPDCSKPFAVKDLETDDFIGRRILASVDIDTSVDPERNKFVAYHPIP